MSSEGSIIDLTHDSSTEDDAFDDEEEETNEVTTGQPQQQQEAIDLTHDSSCDDGAFYQAETNEGDGFQLQQRMVGQQQVQERRSTHIAGTLVASISSLPVTRLVNDVLPGKCVICQEQYQVGDIRKTLPCFHHFHQHCIDRWLGTNKTCPICKHSVRSLG